MESASAVCETASLSLSSEKQMCYKKIAQNKITFTFQIIAIYVIILAAIINLSLQQKDKEIWLVLLSSCIGYVLPNPGLKFKSRKGYPADLEKTDKDM